jgi:two-component system NtrC family sensor kinase
MTGPETAALRAEIVRLNKVVEALMNRAERDLSSQGSSFGVFQSTIVLEGQVRNRTRALEAALLENEKMTRALQSANERLEQDKEKQRQLLSRLEEAHSQLLQSEKLASIGQLAAGVAHEINNPMSFINSNLDTLAKYVEELLEIVAACDAGEAALATDAAALERFQAAKRDADLNFMREDIGALIAESIEGSRRVRLIVQDLRDFSRVGEHEWEQVDLHRDLDATLNVVHNEIKHKAETVLEYGDLPPVECLPHQLSQVFMNLLMNAAQAIPNFGRITVRTACDGDEVTVAICDDGVGMSAETVAKIFDPFFTTKPVGKGTGLGLSVSYGIVERHGGPIEVASEPGVGSTFTVHLPVRRSGREASV